jgi:hypothetical protein
MPNKNSPTPGMLDIALLTPTYERFSVASTVGIVFLLLF